MNPTVLEVERVPRPLYATQAGIRELLGLPEKALLTLAESGRVRSRKIGHARQWTRLYRVADALEWLESDEAMEDVQ